MEKSTKWLSITSLILQYASFWLAAPQVLGEKGMHSMERVLAKTINLMLRFIIIFGSWIPVFMGSAIIFAKIFDHFGFRPIFSDGSIRSNRVGIFLILLLLVGMYWPALTTINIASKVADWATAPLIRKLANDSSFRELCLIFGAIIFTIGFIIQLLVVFRS